MFSVSIMTEHSAILSSLVCFTIKEESACNMNLGIFPSTLFYSEKTLL